MLIGGDGDDTLLGGAGDDVLIGGPGHRHASTAGPATTSSSTALAANSRDARRPPSGRRWLKAHARTVKGKTVLKVDGEKRKLPRAKLGKLIRTV